MCFIHREQPSSWGVEVSSGKGSGEVKTSWHLSDKPLVDHFSSDSGKFPRKLYLLLVYSSTAWNILHMIVAFWWLKETRLSTTPHSRCAPGGLSEWREWEDCILQNDGVLQPGQLQLAGQNHQLCSVHCKCYLIHFKCAIWSYFLTWYEIRGSAKVKKGFIKPKFITISHWMLTSFQ